MKTVEVVIKLHPDFYEMIKKHNGNFYTPSLSFCETICHAIKDGTVLPKGHGRLIDADAVLEDPYGNTYKDIDVAETILEADKEAKEYENNSSKV